MVKKENHHSLHLAVKFQALYLGLKLWLVLSMQTLRRLLHHSVPSRNNRGLLINSTKLTRIRHTQGKTMTIRGVGGVKQPVMWMAKALTLSEAALAGEEEVDKPETGVKRTERVSCSLDFLTIGILCCI